MSSSTKITRHDLDESVFVDIDKDISELQTSNNSLKSDKQDKHNRQTVTLSVSSWSNNSQTITCSGVTENNTIIIAPESTSIEAYGKAEVKCITQNENSLTFTCKKTPEAEINVNVLILGV